MNNKTNAVKRVRKIKSIIGKDCLFSILNFMRFIPDRMFLKLEYRVLTGKHLNLNNPQTFNEKLQYLKLYDRKPLYTTMADKLEMRSFVKNKTGKDLTVPLLGQWENFDEIDFNALPNSFVLKCNHDSKGLVICHDKSSLDMQKTRKIIVSALKKNMFWAAREWPYKNIKPKIFCESLIENIKEYQVLCFEGEPKILYVMDRTETGELTEDFFDMDFKKINLSLGYPKSSDFSQSEVQSKKPYCFDEIKKYSRILSKDCPHLRVDFIVSPSNLYVGELTFYNDAGFAPVSPPEMDALLGKWISLNI